MKLSTIGLILLAQESQAQWLRNAWQKKHVNNNRGGPARVPFKPALIGNNKRPAHQGYGYGQGQNNNNNYKQTSNISNNNKINNIFRSNFQWSPWNSASSKCINGKLVIHRNCLMKYGSKRKVPDEFCVGPSTRTENCTVKSMSDFNPVHYAHDMQREENGGVSDVDRIGDLYDSVDEDLDEMLQVNSRQEPGLGWEREFY